jgi:hypothetical protein
MWLGWARFALFEVKGFDRLETQFTFIYFIGL